MKKSFLLLSSILLSSCAFISTANLEKKMDPLIGADMEVIFDKIGYPEREQTFGDTKVYTWREWSSWAGGGECFVKVIAKDDKMFSYEWYGYLDACRTLADRLTDR